MLLEQKMQTKIYTLKKHPVMVAEHLAELCVCQVLQCHTFVADSHEVNSNSHLQSIWPACKWLAIEQNEHYYVTISEEVLGGCTVYYV